MNKNNTDLTRVAVIGCGSVAQNYHIPILAGHEKAKLAVFVDRDEKRIIKLADTYKVSKISTSISILNKKIIDAALIAAPANNHAPYSIELMKKGIHVLVEKPMSTTIKEAEAMVRISEESKVVLSVGLFRRLLPSVRLLKAIIESKQYGEPKSFHFRWGGFYGWSAFTLANMNRELAGGGVLMDLGPHVLDLIFAILGDSAELMEYHDNSLGGVEADCSLRLRIFYQNRVLEGLVELARTRVLGSVFQIECEQGTLELQIGERYCIRTVPKNMKLRDVYLNKIRAIDVNTKWSDQAESPGYEVFREEIDDWLHAIYSKKESQLSGRSVLPAVRITEKCYQNVKPIKEPWVYEGLDRNNQNNTNVKKGAKKAHRVLITGASGFIGCRLAEILKLREEYEIKALIHDPNHAARLARLPIEMVTGNLKFKKDIQKAVQGCDAIIHCGIGTAYGQRKEIFNVTVGGTNNLVEAALKAGVKRFIHISSMAVYGQGISGILDESAPIRPVKNDDYSESKAKAERVAKQAAKKGLYTIIFRPSTVYGPFAPLIQLGPVKKLLEGKMLMLKSALGIPTNTIYIDNLAEAIKRALEAEDPSLNGEVFNLNDDDGYTYEEFYRYFADSVGIKLPIIEDEETNQYNKAVVNKYSQNCFTSWLRGFSEVFASKEFRAFIRKILETNPIGKFPRYIINNFPFIMSCFQKETATIYRREPLSISDYLVVKPPLSARVSCNKACRLLDYSPVVSRERGMQLTLDWLKYAHLV